MLEEKSAKVTALRRKFLWLYILAAVACILAATVVSLAFISAFKAPASTPQTETPAGNQNNENTQKNPETSQNGETNPPNNETPGNNETPIVIPEGSVQWITAPGISSGSLVLVNAEHPYLSDSADNVQSGSLQIVNVKNNRTSETKNLQVSANDIELAYAFVDALCKMADDMVTGCQNTTRDLMVHTGFKRDNEPNASEFFTGLSTELRLMDLTLNPTRYYQLKDPDAVSTAISQWLMANCHNYGIIQRYPASKVSQTGTSASVSQYRYVGVVHAKYMHEMNYSLEEYVEAVKAYNFNKRLDITVDGTDYSLYYVKEADSSKGIPVPKDATYEISGNNIDGYIVLIQK